MKDFIKIFLVLCAIVSAFFFGRNYGETTKVESAEFKNLKSDNFNNQNAQTELNNLKEKFQKLLDSSDLKKADEILGQIMTIFLADLSLKLSDDKQKDLDEGKKICSTNFASQKMAANKAKTAPPQEIKSEPTEKEQPTRRLPQESARFKMGEFEISEARDTQDIRKALMKVEVKKIDTLMEGSDKADYSQSRKFLGTYRGTVIDVTGSTYGTLVMEIKSTPAAKSPLSGSIKLFKDGRERIGDSFDTKGLGYTSDSMAATMLQFGSGNYLQIYKIDSQQKIAGIFYERLPNGTSKTIGTFILSRTDFTD